MRPLLLLSFLVAFAARADQLASGRWEGVATVPGRELKLVVDLAQENGGGWLGSIIIPGLGLKGTALTGIAADGAGVTFAVKNALIARHIDPPKFEARFTGEGSLTGEMIQAGNRAPFTLRKIGPPEIEPARRSTAIAREVEGAWHGQYELFHYPRKVTLKLMNRSNESATAEFVIVGRKVNTLPVDLVTQSGDFLTVDSSETGFSFEGRVTKDAIDGLVLQGPLEIPLVLKRAK